MSTDGTTPTGTTAAPETVSTDPTAPVEQPVDETTTRSIGDGSPAGEEPEPGWIARHTATLIAVMVAVAVAAAAITGVVLYRHNVDQANADTEAAFRQMVSGQGATLETVECDGGTCAAVINGAAYTVLVQEDEDGQQHFGVTDFVGN